MSSEFSYEPSIKDTGKVYYAVLEDSSGVLVDIEGNGLGEYNYYCVNLYNVEELERHLILSSLIGSYNGTVIFSDIEKANEVKDRLWVKNPSETYTVLIFVEKQHTFLSFEEV